MHCQFSKSIGEKETAFRFYVVHYALLVSNNYLIIFVVEGYVLSVCLSVFLYSRYLRKFWLDLDETRCAVRTN